MTTYAKPITMKAAPRAYTEDQKKKHRTDLKKHYEEEKKLIRGKFLCFEPRGGSVSFVYRKYEWENPVQYNLRDGEEYEIPLGVARHLNGIDITAKELKGDLGTCGYTVHQHQQDNVGNVSVQAGKRIRRYAFQSLTGEHVG